MQPQRPLSRVTTSSRRLCALIIINAIKREGNVLRIAIDHPDAGTRAINPVRNDRFESIDEQAESLVGRRDFCGSTRFVRFNDRETMVQQAESTRHDHQSFTILESRIGTAGHMTCSYHREE